ncbi:MAG: hypothetical protein ABEK01_00430 [Candidatus Nanohaloarchaea archaeon]
MGRKLAVFGVLLLSTTAFATAQAGSNLDDNKLGGLKGAINGNTGILADIFGILIGEQRINLHLSMGDDARTYSIHMNGATIHKIESGRFKDPTVTVNTTASDIQQIGTSDTPIKTLKKKIRTDALDYRAHGLINKLRIRAAELLFI